MLKINKKLFKNGFSLIELMVAVAILAMAIFGIFHAYSTGFMGMADARAVTVATNYAREAMEDIKNMDFDKIPTSESSSVTVNGITYNRQVIVQENPNIKRVITTVTWEDRNGKQKMVETDMVVHFIETTAGDPTRIMLYADPYNVLVLDPVDYPTNTYKYISTITAVIKDAIGNTVTTWNENINFSLTGSGTLSSYTVTPDNFENGKAIITFISDTDEGEVTITASTEGLTSDSVTINVYDEDIPVKINLTASPMFLTPDTVTESIITATIVNAGEGTVEIIKEINFSVSGPGTLSEYTSYTTAAGITTITLYLTLESPLGTITITASDPDFVLESGVVNIMTGGQITLSASLMEVPAKEISIITVTTKDISDVPIQYIGIINLSLVSTDGGSGTLSSNSSNFDEDTYELTFNGDNSSETVIFTASFEGTVNVTAEDSNAILTSDTLTLTVTEELTPHHLVVYAMPLSIPAGGAETLITAKVMTEGNVKITSYNNEPVTFQTTAGSFSSSTDLTIYTTVFNDGIATAVLYSPSVAGTATITVCSPSDTICTISGETTVGFYIGPDHIELTADPQNILVGGQNCIVTAKIVDNGGTVIGSYNEDIAFNISVGWDDTIKFSKATTAFLTQKFKKGIAIVTLISGNKAGTAVIDAYSGDVSGSLNIPVGISSLTLVEGSVDYSEVNTVSFNVNIIGEPITLRQMQVSWQTIGDPPETLNKIDIAGITIYANDPYDHVGSIGYTENSNEMVADIDVTDTTLPAGTYTIVMYFSGDISGKTTLDVTFNPNSGDYLVDLIIL